MIIKPKNNFFLLTCLIVLLASSFVFGMQDALGPNGINAYAVHERGITGDGVKIGLLTAGTVRDSHAAFERKAGSAVKLHDFTGAGFARSAHDTQMAAIMISNGSPSHPDQIGVAPGAKIHNGRISSGRISTIFITKTLDELILKQHCRVIVTGIQLPGDKIAADGNSIWSKIYDYYAETYDVIFANAAGNSHKQPTIFGDSYNGITTAGLRKDTDGAYRQCGRISNPGPSVDGRRKPDVAAGTEDMVVPNSTGDGLWTTIDPNGLGLTSFSVPQTAGVAALLLEAAGKSKAENDDRSEVIKAVMINSTVNNLLNKKTNPTNPFASADHWDAETGYGRLNAYQAYQTLAAKALIPDTVATQNKGWAYGVMPKNSEHTYLIEGKANQRLVVTVVWHRKLNKISPSAYFEASPRFFVDLKIITPDGQTPVFETAGRNNVIKTEHLLKQDGVYKVVLKNSTWCENGDYGMALKVY
ncbi:MAG: S8 family serine peptidase [Planctomycetota bacterium]|jgi:hypothetical protein